MHTRALHDEVFAAQREASRLQAALAREQARSQQLLASGAQVGGTGAGSGFASFQFSLGGKGQGLGLPLSSSVYRGKG